MTTLFLFAAVQGAGLKRRAPFPEDDGEDWDEEDEWQEDDDEWREEEEDVNEAFRLTAEGIREVRRRLEKRGIEGVGYKIEKSDG